MSSVYTKNNQESIIKYPLLKKYSLLKQKHAKKPDESSLSLLVHSFISESYHQENKRGQRETADISYFIS